MLDADEPPAIEQPATDPAALAGVNSVDALIGAPCPVIYPLLRDRSAWMASFVSRDVVEVGDAAGVDELSRVKSRVEGVEMERFERILRAEPGQRLTLEMLQSPVVAFADYRLRTAGKGCDVALNITIYAPVIRYADAASRAAYSKNTQTKIEGDMAKLKEVAEARSKAPTKKK